MAYESFAGERITGAPGRQFKLRGGGVPTSDIPNLPKADLSMPTANYPSIPTIRHQEMSLPNEWGRRAGQLQQENLPASFEHGAKRIAAAAGQGQQYMGEQISKGSAKLAAGFGNLAEGINEYQTKLQHETQNSVVAKEDNAYDVARAKFNLRVEKEGISSKDYQEQFWNNEGKEYLQTVDGLKGQARSGIFGSRKTSDDLDSKVVGRQAGFAAFSINKQAEETHQSNVQAHQFRYDNALAENRFDDARTALTDARAANTINDGQAEKMAGQIKTAENKWYADSVVDTNPWAAKEEAESIIKASEEGLKARPTLKEGGTRRASEAGPSVLFPGMDKVQAKDMLDRAEKSIAEKNKTNGDAVLKKASAGNFSEEQIREEAKQAHLDQTQTDAIIKSVSEHRPYNDGKAANAYAEVNSVDFRDPKTAMSELNRVRKLVLDTTDPGTRETLIKEINQKWESRDKPTTLQATEKTAVSDLVKSWFPSTDKEREKATSGMGSERAKIELERLDKEKMELMLEIDRYVEANREFEPNKLREHIIDKHTPAMQKDSQRAANQTPGPAVDMRTPYLGAVGTPIPPPKAGEGLLSLRPEDIAAREAKATEGKPAPAAPGYTTVGAGYVIPAQPGKAVEDVQPPDTGTSGAPTPYTAPHAAQLTPEGGLTATQMPPGKLLPSKGLSSEGTPMAEPVHGYTPAPTPSVPRIAPPETAAKPPQPPVAVTGTGEAAKFSHVGGALSGKQDAFTSAGKKYGIEPELLMAISAHETGNGTSEFLTKYNNPGGLMDPKTDWSEPQKFATLEEGIDAFARNLKEKYLDQGLTTIEAIASKYAPTKNPDGSPVKNDPRGLNKLWPSDVKAIYAQLKGEAPAGQPRETVATAEAATPEEIASIDERSRTNISTLKPEAQKPISNFIARAIKWGNERGVKVVVVEGYRSPERQNELYAQGRTKPGPIVTNARAGQSRHQSARAVDVAIIKNGKILEGKEYDKYIKELGKMGVAMGLEWGGNFKSIYDPDHFQFNG